MDPVTAFSVVQGVASVASGLSARSQNMNEAARADSEARLADTKALQRDTQSRDELTRFLSTVMAARGANGLSTKSPNARLLEGDAASISDEERLRQRADDRQRAANFRAAAKGYRKAAKFSLLTGIAGAATPLGEYASYKGWG